MPEVAISGDRRSRKRYSLRLPLEYSAIVAPGQVTGGIGTSVDLSSTGICFRTAADLPVGSYLQISVAWPARDGRNVVLWLTGFVVWCSGFSVGVSVTSRTFRPVVGEVFNVQ